MVDRVVPDTPGAGRCHHYVANKGRCCPFTTKGGAEYCREHAAMHGDKGSSAADSPGSTKALLSGSRRVLCPYDTSHSVELGKLERHMRSLCNARPPEIRPPYTHPDCNVASLPPAYSSDSCAEPSRLWSEEGLAASDARLMLKPGELIYLNASHGTQVKLNDLGSESVAQILRPVVELYLSRVSPNAANLRSRSLEELLDMVSLEDDFPLDCRAHPLLAKAQSTSKHAKHTMQQSSLLGHLEDRGCLNPQNAFIEFGAGKGELSVFVHEALASKKPSNSSSPSSIFLVDRKNFRQKYSVEKTSNCQTPQDQFKRIYIDIRDLDLSKVPELQITDPATGMLGLRPIVAYSKHLCGAATDLTIRCLQRYQDAGGSVAGIAIALCCHHCCKYSMYTNLAYLSQTLALAAGANNSIDYSRSDAAWNGSHRNMFRQISAMSSWAVNAPPPPLLSQAPESGTEPHHSGLTYAQRMRAGHAVKRALDLGRLEYVRRSLGMANAELVYFTPRTTSPENLSLIGTEIG
ncbi:tRNA:m4X modification enzyme [Coemansia sp. RSA 1813]|nr:tRNA:m4X modification enzyme [Coemansia sp. RSA 1646]KAJ1773294.1 tRNA:m4X modification enzyme [Coemansia sp. RSA 1843]KAJ2092762.1 tRNA:m4X modification enzyme [Coemansia sp. RSA 986]KAJ2217739.1 tRNA:m4X modification enzyme [Coemansia sp. RSA 487]KAJ2573024.1 tRNA:m4X modification enzyme [Coemansia sp. RSA 1813]